MKNLFSHFVLLLCCISLTQTNAQKLIFNKTFGGPGYDDIRSMVVDEDGNAIVTGLSKSGNDPTGNVYISKISPQGDVLFYQEYGRLEEDGGNGLMRTADGGYVISGHTALPDVGDECDAMVTKLDKNFKQEWQVTLGGVLDETCYQSIEMPDKTIWVVGVTEIIGNYGNEKNTVIHHLSRYGTYIETDTVFRKLWPTRNLIFKLQNNSVIVSGIYRNEYEPDKPYPGAKPTYFPSFLIKLDVSNFPSQLIENAPLVSKTNNNGITVRGLLELPKLNSLLYFGHFSQSSQFKTTIKSHAILHHNETKVNTEIKSLSQFDNGDIIDGKISDDGFIYLLGHDGINYFISKLTEDLTLSNITNLPSLRNSAITCLSLGTEDDMYLCGMDYTTSDTQMIINRYRLSSFATNNYEFTDDDYMISPNPSTNEFLIENKSTNTQHEWTDIRLLDISGKSLVVPMHMITKSKYTINTSSLNNGLYYLQLSSQHETITKKIIIQK